MPIPIEMHGMVSITLIAPFYLPDPKPQPPNPQPKSTPKQKVPPKGTPKHDVM
jgi:hypothetical protein